MRVVVRRGPRRRGGGGPGGTGSRSMPAASIVDRVLGSCRRPVVAASRSSGRAPRPSLHRRGRAARPGASASRGTLPRDECTDRTRRRTRGDSPRDPFGARASLGAGLPDFYRLTPSPTGSTWRPRPSRSRSSSRTSSATPAAGIVEPSDVETLAVWRAGRRRRGRDPVHARAGHPPGLHRRPGDRRPRGHARRDGRPRRRPGARQPARAGRPRHRPLGPGRPVRDAGRVRLQRRARVRAQRRALPAAALGPDGVPRPAGRAARDGHRPPGQPRVPRDGRDGRADDGGPAAGSPTPTRSSGPTPTRR